MPNDIPPPASPQRRFPLSRRLFMCSLPFALAGCASSVRMPVARSLAPRTDPTYVAMYGPLPGERFPIPAVDLRQIDPAFYRRRVEYEIDEPVGTIVVDPSECYLYLLEQERMAMRYGIGVGREGFGWSGRATVRRKAEWPTWTPPASMVARDEKARRWAGGMPPGLDNPLGARALYLFQGARDTLYRIHGTNEPWTIGRNVSSGCIRMINQDAIDLFRRVPLNTEVLVLEADSAPTPSSSGSWNVGGLV